MSSTQLATVTPTRTAEVIGRAIFEAVEARTGVTWDGVPESFRKLYVGYGSRVEAALYAHRIVPGAMPRMVPPRLAVEIEEWRAWWASGRVESRRPGRPAWSVISTDRDKPTLARVTLGETLDHVRWPNPAEWVVEDNGLYAHWSDDWMFVAHVSHITHVELLHTHNPETHVPVERALVDEVRGLLRNMVTYKITVPDRERANRLRTDLASLASDESSDTDGGRS